MSGYKIKPYSYERALDLGVKIKSSKNPKYKIDVFDWNNNFITSVGSPAYKDFPSYYEDKGLDYALQRRELYRKRHKREIKQLGENWLGSRSYYAWNILW
jgi:hypothetical protein